MLNENPIIRHWQEMLDPKNAYRWLAFMDDIHAQLPLILRIGKPRTEDVEASIIGRAGFSSWKELVEAPKPAGFGWNHATFDSWKRAYKHVLEHTYLREIELTASQINTIYRESKPNFPKTLDEFNAFSDVRKQKQVELHQNSLKDAKNRNTELEKALTSAKEDMAGFEHVAKQLQDLKEDHRALIAESIRIQTLLDDRNSDVIILHEKVDELTKNKEESLKTIAILDDRASEITFLHEKIAELTKRNIGLELKIKNPAHIPWIKRFLSLFGQ